MVEEVREIYRIHLINEIKNKYVGILLAISDTKLSIFSIDSLKKYSKGVIYNLKGFLINNQID
jgi:hypothetical protein